MKNSIKMVGIIALTAVIVFGMAGCLKEVDNTVKYGPVHFKSDDTAKFFTSFSGEKILEYYPAWTKPSNAYKSYTGSEKAVAIFVVVRNPDPNPEAIPEFVYTPLVGAGTILNGTLDFTVDPLSPPYLMDWEDLKSFVFDFWDTKVVGGSANEPRGNVLQFWTYDSDRLNREIITGNHISLSQELIHFIYVDKKCVLEGKPKSGNYGSSYYIAESDLNLNLEEGWNTVWRKESYSIYNNIATISMEVKNPNNLKWILYVPRVSPKEEN